MFEETTTVRMPDLTWPRHGFHHTVDSALMSLMRLGVSPERITIKKVGRGWPELRVVAQQPVAGEGLTADKTVALDVAGDGYFHHLPVGMREASKEGEIGTEEFCSIFDDSLEKAGYYARQGGLFFYVRPSNPAGCERWIKLFGIDPHEWPEARWYRLAVLLPCLRYLAGREAGLRLALRLLLDLEIANICWLPRYTPLAKADYSLLGSQASQLGVDLIIGDGIDDEAALEITLGPTTLETYRYFQNDEGKRRLDQTLRLVAPYHWDYEPKWLVGDVNRAPRLGSEADNAVLGVNSHLGKL